MSKRLACSVCLLATALVLTTTADGDAQEGKSQRSLVNDGTIRLMAGAYESTDMRLAVDLANALDEGYDLRIIPMVGKGSVRNVEDLLYLRGVDIAMVQSDVFDFYRRNGLVTNIDERLRYIAKLNDEEVHILARSDFQKIDDLRDRRVNFGPPGSGEFMTAGIIFNDLGLEVDVTTYPSAIAIQRLREGEIDAMVLVDGAPINLLTELGAEQAFNLLAVPPSRISGTYMLASLTSDDYPNLIKSYAPVETVAVSMVLAAYNWPADNPRGEPVNRFVDRLFGNFEKLLGPAFHPKWQDVDLTDDLPGWQRLPSAQAATAQVASAVVQYGEYLSFECVACHRANEAAGAIPTIAVLPAPYFINALKSYRGGSRSHLVMQDVAFSLNDEQMEALAAYFESLREASQ